MGPFVIILGSGKLIISDKYMLLIAFLGGNYEKNISLIIDNISDSSSSIYAV
jgi:hypothetical protein